MAKNDVELRKTDSILDELDQLQRTISQRAFDLFKYGGALWGNAMTDWLTAERELVWKPPIELRRKDGHFEVLVATAGVAPKDLDVQITSEDLLIKADIHHEHATEEGTVAVCEFQRGRLFRSIHFPEKIDPDRVKAEYRDGMLRLTAAIAKVAPTKVEIKAA